MLHGGARPMVDGVAQADVSGLSHKSDFALARSLGDWRDARQASQGVVISPSQRIRGFCCKFARNNDPLRGDFASNSDPS